MIGIITLVDFEEVKLIDGVFEIEGDSLIGEIVGVTEILLLILSVEVILNDFDGVGDKEGVVDKDGVELDDGPSGVKSIFKMN